MKILLAFGTRPEIIKLGPLCRTLAEDSRVELDVFWTGQHMELADGLLELFEIEATQIGNDVMEEKGLGGKLGRMICQIEQALTSKHYDMMIVQGDTMTAAAAATAAFVNRVPVAHVEAGLRTGNLNSPWPEEFNRRMVMLCANLHFAPTERAKANLLAEGVDPSRVFVVGNTVIDALQYVREKISRNYEPWDPVIRTLPINQKLILVTTHRRENFGEPLRQVLFALKKFGADGDKAIVLPTHMNPVVRSEVLRILGRAPNVHLLQPLRYTDFVYLMTLAWVVVTDSGGVQEEAPTFGLPILITRDTTERPEVIEAGFGHLVGSDFKTITETVRRLTASSNRTVIDGVNPFGRGDSAQQIVDTLLIGEYRARAVRQ
jgi:UDP-N-acetylglucosamine 2-epimerase